MPNHQRRVAAVRVVCGEGGPYLKKKKNRGLLRMYLGTLAVNPRAGRTCRLVLVCLPSGLFVWSERMWHRHTGFAKWARNRLLTARRLLGRSLPLKLPRLPPVLAALLSIFTTDDRRLRSRFMHDHYYSSPPPSFTSPRPLFSSARTFLLLDIRFS